MKNNEMDTRGIVSLNLPQKFADDHPVVATVIYLSPVLIPVICKGTKYIVDTIADCYRYKVMAENGITTVPVADDLETIPTDDSIVA